MRRKKIQKKLPEKSGFSDEIKTIVKGVFYVSETDSEIFPFEGEQCETVSAEELLRQLGRNEPVEERDFEDFFKRLTEIQEWFGDEETATANKFSELKEFLIKNLKDLRVLKVGKIEVDIYIVGLNSENRLAGVWTKAVET